MDTREMEAMAADPMIGHVVAGRFEIEARIGAGGMGTVYRAVQSPLGRRVALKILKQDVSWDPDTVTRFHREAKAMSLLVHPNTVRVFDFGQTPEGLLYLAMEMLEGELLTDKIDREGQLDVVDAIRVTQQVLASLHEAHSKGIVHRDLKPDNIFLAGVDGHEEPVVKVLDFGIAKVVQGENEFDQLETQAGTVFGTPRYMSPEQAQGKTLDPRTDLYSVGVLIYQLLTGTAPFIDEDAVVVMAKHIQTKPVAPRALAPERPIPTRLEKSVLKALEKAPAKRFQSADEMVRALERCVPEVRAIEAEGRGFFQRAPFGALAIGLVVLLGFIGAAGWIISSADDPVSAQQAPSGVTSSTATVTATTPAAPEITVGVLTSEPTGALVYRGEDLIGTTPLRFPLNAEDGRLEVKLRLVGYADASGVLAADGVERSVALSPAAVAVTDTVDEAPTTMRRRRNRRRASMSSGGGAMSDEPRPPAMMGYEMW